MTLMDILIIIQIILLVATMFIVIKYMNFIYKFIVAFVEDIEMMCENPEEPSNIYETLDRKELQAVAKSRKIKNYYRMTKKELIEKLLEGDE